MQKQEEKTRSTQAVEDAQLCDSLKRSVEGCIEALMYWGSHCAGVFTCEQAALEPANVVMPDHTDTKTAQLDALQFEEVRMEMLKHRLPGDAARAAAEHLLSEDLYGCLCGILDEELLARESGESDSTTSIPKMIRTLVPVLLQATVEPKRLAVVLSPAEYVSEWSNSYLMPAVIGTPAMPEQARKAAAICTDLMCREITILQDPEEGLSDLAARASICAKHMGAGIMSLCESVVPNSAIPALHTVKAECFQSIQRKAEVDKDGE